MARVTHLLFLSLMLMCGCSSEEQLLSYVDSVDSRGWRDAAHLTIENRDTTSLRDITIFLLYHPEVMSAEERITQRVQSTKIPLNVVTRTPDGVSVAEQVVVDLANDGDTERNSVTAGRGVIHCFDYRGDVLWSEEGDYQMFIYPRGEEIIGVEAVGVEIELK